MWYYKNSILAEYPTGAIGFIYMIEFPDGKRYIGKKNLFSRRKRKFGKKEIAKMTDKRLKTYEYVTKDSDWRDYNSSNKDVIQRIKNKDLHRKSIIAFATHKKQLTYLETQILFAREVLIDDRYYNDNILGKFFQKDVLEWEQIKK